MCVNVEMSCRMGALKRACSLSRNRHPQPPPWRGGHAGDQKRPIYLKCIYSAALSGGRVTQSKRPELSMTVLTREWKKKGKRKARKKSMCHRNRPICGATLTAINDTVCSDRPEGGGKSCHVICLLQNSSAGPPSILGWQAGGVPVVCNVHR